MSKHATADVLPAPPAAPPDTELWSRRDFDGFIGQLLKLNAAQRQLFDALTLSTAGQSRIRTRRPSTSLLDYVFMLEDDIETGRRRREIDARARDIYGRTLGWLQDCLRAVEPCRGVAQLKPAPIAATRRMDGAALIWRDLYVAGAAERMSPEIEDGLLDILRHYRSPESEQSVDELRAGAPAALRPLIDAFEAAAGAAAIRAAFIDIVRATGPADA